MCKILDFCTTGNVCKGRIADLVSVSIARPKPRRFCLTAGVATLAELMERDAVELCGPRHVPISAGP